MTDAIAEIRRNAEIILAVQMPQAKACNGAHFALLKAPKLEFAADPASALRFNLANALRSACLAFRAAPAGELRRAVLELISRSLELLDNALKE